MFKKFNDFVNEAIENKSRQLHENLIDVLPHIQELGNHTIIVRSMKIQQVSGVAEISSEGWKKGTVGLEASVNKSYMSFYEKFTKHFGIKNIICTSHPKSVADYFKWKTIFGTPFIFIPKGKYKLLWSPNVSDLGVELGKLEQTTESFDDFDLTQYKTTWPNQPIGEVIFDCETYYLLDLTRLAFMYGAIWSMLINKDLKPIGKNPGKKAELLNPTTYADITKYLEWVIENKKQLS